jgi:hypothetical protein
MVIVTIGPTIAEEEFLSDRIVWKKRDEELFHLTQRDGLEIWKITDASMMVIVWKMKGQKMNHRPNCPLRWNRTSLVTTTSGLRAG